MDEAYWENVLRRNEAAAQERKAKDRRERRDRAAITLMPFCFAVACETAEVINAGNAKMRYAVKMAVEAADLLIQTLDESPLDE